MNSTQHNPQPGLIFEYTYTGEAYFRATLNADLTVTMVDAQTTRTVTVSSLYSLGTLEMWAKRCLATMNGEATYCTLGPVGERMAQRYAEGCKPLGNKRGSAFHRALARLGIPSHAHYEVCGMALAHPVASLAALSEHEARKAWAYARREYTSAHAA